MNDALRQFAQNPDRYTWISSDTDNARIWNVSLFSTYGLPSGLSLSSSIGYTQVSTDHQDTTGGVTTNSTLSFGTTAAVQRRVMWEYRGIIPL